MKKKAHKTVKTGFLLVAILVSAFTGCSSNSLQSDNTNRQANQPEKTTASFINKVWKVSKSNSVASGHLYVFLSDGTLVITSPQSKPAFGAWTYEDGTLTMIENSAPYKVDVLKLSESEFNVKINSPGEPVEIEFVPATEAERTK